MSICVGSIDRSMQRRGLWVPSIRIPEEVEHCQDFGVLIV